MAQFFLINTILLQMKIRPTSFLVGQKEVMRCIGCKQVSIKAKRSIVIMKKPGISVIFHTRLQFLHWQGLSTSMRTNSTAGRGSWELAIFHWFSNDWLRNSGIRQQYANYQIIRSTATTFICNTWTKIDERSFLNAPLISCYKLLVSRWTTERIMARLRRASLWDVANLNEGSKRPHRMLYQPFRRQSPARTHLSLSCYQTIYMMTRWVLATYRSQTQFTNGNFVLILFLLF
jgi:hypothetical protein